MSLDYLTCIWCSSQAEYETLLDREIREKWLPLIGGAPNHLIKFHIGSEMTNATGTFHMRAVLTNREYTYRRTINANGISHLFKMRIYLNDCLHIQIPMTCSPTKRREPTLGSLLLIRYSYCPCTSFRLQRLIKSQRPK